MNFNLATKAFDFAKIAEPIVSKPLEIVGKVDLVAQRPGAQSPVELGDIFDGGQLPAGCFACGLAFSSNFGEQFLGQFFGL